MNSIAKVTSEEGNIEEHFDPIIDIIDYLVRCAEISFKNSPSQEGNRSADKTKYAYDLFYKSPIDFLLQFGKYLCPSHLKHFETLHLYKNDKEFEKCVTELKLYHSEENKHKRIRNRRYKAIQDLQNNSDYFSEKQMMYRNPLLYEELIGQYLTDEEIKIRDSADSENLTLLTLILDTVDRNQLRENRNLQMQMEDAATSFDITQDEKAKNNEKNTKKKQWGDFDVPDTEDIQKPEPRKQMMINANERNLLREEFLQEMYSSFMEGRDIEFDYNSVDHNEEYDDLAKLSQDAEDKYFDSEGNDSQTLEEHMALVNEYGSKTRGDDNVDPLDVFMERISNKLSKNS
ncbi:unnamed protein product [Leptosia nina]|uniref:CCD97-like C-terminal domain-containing protein n=1 Tax=Leptosia nina TaxID=320188 RepID=A0AAV1IUZ7_9NEOP